MGCEAKGTQTVEVQMWCKNQNTSTAGMELSILVVSLFWLNGPPCTVGPSLVMVVLLKWQVISSFLSFDFNCCSLFNLTAISIPDQHTFFFTFFYFLTFYVS